MYLLYAPMPASIKEAVALLLLALCWAATLTCSCLLVSISPLVAQILGASEALAPFTCGAFLLGAALASCVDETDGADDDVREAP